MQIFSTSEIERESDLIDLSKALGLFVFRGQADRDWKLSTTLERAYARSGQTVYSLENTEHWMLHEFRSKFHLHAPISPQRTNAFEWLALMQHHGGATRLLDFTYSIYVATYFSLLNSSTDSAIWAINHPLLRDNLFGFADLKYRKGRDLKDVVNDHHIEIFNASVARADHLGETGNLTHLVPLESQSLFDRASRQRSLFIGAGYLGGIGKPYSFMDNLVKSFPGIENHLESPRHVELEKLCSPKADGPCYKNFGVLKIIVPKRLHGSLRAQLALMGLTEESLFPGVDGLSRSLVQTHIMR